MLGQTIEHYQILNKLGEGGMGVVYRARDTKLGRDVAIKVLPETLVRDSARMTRFQREAQLLARLNHPNIAAIYGVEESNGQYALVMELAEGLTLADRLGAGAIPSDEVLSIARQIAEALEAAHEKGIIHRDLKPANVKVDGEGNVKVLDFGLAKALADQPASTNPATSPTLTIAATQAGVILGTAAYMSPEQARGKQADARADIWSFGVLLWEMLTGRQLFGGETVSDSLASVLKTDPDFSALPKGTPVRIRRMLRRCLTRNRNRRLQAIGEARIAIEDALSGVAEEETAPGAAPAQPQRAWLPWAVVGVLAAVLLAVWWWPAPPPAEQPLVRLRVDLGRDLTTGWGSPVILSPDGSRLVFVSSDPGGERRLFTQLLSEAEPRRIDGTDRARNPFFSPDGNWVGFSADRQLKKVMIEGGVPVGICDAINNGGAAWGRDGTIVASVAVSGGLVQVPAAGGTPEPATQLDPNRPEDSHRWPQFLPDGKSVLFTAGLAARFHDGATIDVQSLATGQRKTLVRGGVYGRYLPSGHLVYSKDGALFAAPMDANRLELTGSPVPILAGMSGFQLSGGADYDASQTGTLVYLPGERRALQWGLEWILPDGNSEPLLSEPGNYFGPEFSPDGKKLAVSILDGANMDIWVLNLQRGTRSRLTSAPGEDRQPVWFPDGKQIAYSSYQDGTVANIYAINSDGTGEPRRLTESEFAQIPFSISADGKFLLYSELIPPGHDIGVLPLDGGQPEIILQDEFGTFNPSLSPDGRWLAYRSNESGQQAVYVRRFPELDQRLPISDGLGRGPVWSADGRQIFYQSESAIMVVDVQPSGDSLRVSKPRRWSEREIAVRTGPWPDYDIVPDGSRAVAPMDLGEDPAERDLRHVVFLFNFFDELHRRVPAGGGTP